MDAATPATSDGPVVDGDNPRRTSWRRTLVSGLLLLVVVVAFGWALAGQWSEVVDALRDQSPWVLLGALVLCAARRLMSFLLWRGHVARPRLAGLPVRPAARMFFVAQLGKYLPGCGVAGGRADAARHASSASRGSGWRWPSC